MIQTPDTLFGCRILLRLPQDLGQQIKDNARTGGQTVSEYIRQALRDKVEPRGKASRR